MARLLPLYVLLLLAAVAGCAHGPASAALATLKPAAEAFHRSIRWRDFRGAEDLIVPERRALFEKAIRARSDEKDLSITDYQLEDIRLSADGTRGIVVSRVSWVRLP